MYFPPIVLSPIKGMAFLKHSPKLGWTNQAKKAVVSQFPHALNSSIP